MMSVEKRNPISSISKQRTLAPNETVLLGILSKDWRRLYPSRRRYGGLIRRVLEVAHDGEHVNARAAFGLIGPEHGADWLYRDFYLDAAPGSPSIDRAVGKLRRGNPCEMLDMLRRGGLSEHVFRRVWYEASTLAGHVLGTLAVERDGSRRSAPLEVMPRASSRPSRVANEDEIAQLIRRSLAAPIGVEPHRQSLLRTLGELRSDSLDAVSADNSLALLMHHMDLPSSRRIRWSQLDESEREAIASELRGLQQAISSPPAFLRHLHRSLCSPSRQRRFLCYRLLRLDGHLDRRSHPDDFASVL